MMEILQAEIVGYSSPKEIFVNGMPRDSRLSFAARRIQID